MSQYLIIGNGVAGTKAAITLRNMDPSAEITVLSADEYPFYLRPKLADFINNKASLRDLEGKKPEFYAQNRLILRLRTRITGVDATNRRVHLADGATIPYDALLIASGGRPIPAPFPGGELDGVLSLKTLADAILLKEKLSAARRAVVMGEGLLGLELARVCREAGLEVTYLLQGNRFWPAVLDDEAADLVERRLEDKYITLHRNATVTEALGSGGRLRYVTLSDGQTLPCDLLCVGLGLQPEVDFLADSGIAMKNGILVDEFMATNVPGIYAAGDVAHQASGLDFGWLRAWEQGTVAGANMAGARKRFTRVPLLSIQAYGLDVMAIGQSNPQGPEYRSLATETTEMNVYKKLVLKGDTVVGGLLVGDVGEASTVEKLVRDKASLDQVEPAIMRRLFDPYYWEVSAREILCPVCKFGIKLGAEAKEGDLITCPICGEEFRLTKTGNRFIAQRL